MNIETIEIILIVVLAVVLFGGSLIVDAVDQMLINNMKEIKSDQKEDDKDKPESGDDNA